MKCTNKKLLSLLIIFSCIVLNACGVKYELPYSADSEVSSFNIKENKTEVSVVEPFAHKLCVIDTNVDASSIDMGSSAYGALFDVGHYNTIYAKNVFERVYPASLTKIMTAIVAIKKLPLDTLLTASSNVYIKDKQAQVINLREGDQLTLEQALNILLVYSANDIAILIAEGVSGSVDSFVADMNAEARELGATNTHFTNPHGLQDEEHYTTPYDLYLMMNEAVKFDAFCNIIEKPSYQTIYYDALGREVEVDEESTNLYISGSQNAPAGITVIGGKTGTTSMAGHCLILYSRDTLSNPYISIVMKADKRDLLYKYTDALLNKIGK